MNIIETLNTAFTTLFKRIWLIVIPVILDMFLWLGPKVSFRPLVTNWVKLLTQAMQSVEAAAETSSTALLSSMLSDIETVLGDTNLLSLLASGRVGVSSVAGLLPISAEDKLVLQLTTNAQLFGMVVLVLALGLLIACVFIGFVSQAVRGEKLNIGTVLKKAPTHWVRLVLVYLPLTFLMSAAISFSMILPPLAFLVMVGALWLSLYLFFVPQAVIMSDASPMEALRNSFIIVRLNFWSALAFVVLMSIISAGFGFIWGRLVGSTAGTVVAILLNALISTGLLAATCIFYQTRLAKWHQLLAQYRANKQ